MKTNTNLNPNAISVTFVNKDTQMTIVVDTYDNGKKVIKAFFQNGYESMVLHMDRYEFKQYVALLKSISSGL